MYVVLLLWSASSGSWMPRRASSGGGFDWGCGWWGLASWMNFEFKDGARLSSRAKLPSTRSVASNDLLVYDASTAGNHNSSLFFFWLRGGSC